MINKKLISLMLSALFLSACTNNAKINNGLDARIDKILGQKQRPVFFEQEKTPTFIRIKTPRDLALDKIVNVAIKSEISLLAAIDYADNSLIVSLDPGIDLENNKVVVRFNNQTLGKYFKYLENLTGYQIELIDGIVYVRSIASKTFNLQTLSLGIEQLTGAAKAEVGEVGGTSSSAPLDENGAKWEKIVTHVKTIMSQSDDKKSVVTENQQLGTISVIGLPSNVKRVAFWLDSLRDSSNRQVHLKVKILDIIVDNAAGRGVNWDLISNQSSQVQISNNATQTIASAGVFSIGTLAGGASPLDLGRKITLDVMLSLLAEQGKVRIENQPNITVTNGGEAYISTGDEFSFVSSVEATPDDSGNVITTSEIERMSVGVELRVTPKILPDDRIVVSIVPIISSIKSFTTLTSGSGSSVQEFQTPNIALQKLATKVIIEDGKTIHLGGLIATKVANASKGLPNAGILDVFFRGVQKSLERREIVILITPTIVR